MGKPARLLMGLGSGNDVGAIMSQALSPDILDRYLPFYPGPNGSWANNFGYSSTPGTYVDRIAAEADSLGAVPMFTLYQFIYAGENNPALLDDRASMQLIWNQTVLLFDRLAAYNKPALVNLEPDFWGYAYNFSPGADPSRRFAWVNITPDCAALPNTIAGIGQCMVAIARNRAPKALIGFPPSDFGFGTQNVIRFMKAVGAQQADFTVMQTLDRDAGCFEARGAECNRPGSNWYWSASQFAQHFAEARAYRDGIGLPLIWWQTPMGVPSILPGGLPQRWRDNRVDTFLRNPQALVDAGASGVVFGAGAETQTDIDTDGGQFQQRWRDYIVSPTPLP